MSSKPRSRLAHYRDRKHAFDDNLPELSAVFPQYPSNLQWSSSKGKRIAVIFTDDPIATATRFAGIASTGFVSESRLPNGYVRKLTDGSNVTLRVTSSSDGSPAVDLNITGEAHMQKIHFVRRKHG